MKVNLFICALVFALGAKAQTPLVSLQFERTTLLQGDTLCFSIWCNSNEALEVMVMTADSILFQQNLHISYSEFPVQLPTANFPSGNYFIIVTGNNIRQEKQFLLTKKD